jgi:hypothetical protein
LDHGDTRDAERGSSVNIDEHIVQILAMTGGRPLTIGGIVLPTAS